MYEKFLKRLRKICRKKKIVLKKTGRTGNARKNPLFSVVLNNKQSPKKTVCFSAGIHGDEISGPLSILKFVENFNYRRFQNIKIILFPVANPSGFDKRKRRNYLNRDLNGHFCDKKLTGENKMLYDAVKNEDIFFFHALHEDIDEKRFYLYNFEKKKEKIYRDIVKFTRKYFPIHAGKYAYGDKVSNGIIINRKDGSFEDRLFRDGIPFAMCTEIPGKTSMTKRISANIAIMNLVIKFTSLN